METLSICMIVKDEENNLDRCLSSLQKLKEFIKTELIIVDTGSTDDTVNIAQRYTDKVFFHQWNKDFAAMRNKSISYAKGQWIMVIDADEVLMNPEGLANSLLDSQISEPNNALLLSVKDFPKGSDQKVFFEYLLPRVFKSTSDFSYEGSVHEQPMYKEPSYVVPGEGLYHFGYDSENLELIERKTKRMSELLLAKLKEEPENIYYLYQLAVTYRMAQRYETGFTYIKKAFELIPEGQWDEYSYVVKHFVLMLRDLKMHSEILKLEKQLKEKMVFGVDLAYMIGEALYHNKQQSEAAHYYEYYLERLKQQKTGLLVKESMTDAIITACFEDSVYLKLVSIYKGFGDFSKAIDVYKKVPKPAYTEDLIKEVVTALLELKDEKTFETLIESLLGLSQDLKEAAVEAVESYKVNHLSDSVGFYQNLLKKLNPMYEILLLARDLYNKGQKVNSAELLQFFNNTLNLKSNGYYDFLYFAMQNGANIFESLVGLSNEHIERIAHYLSKYSDLKELTIQLISENRNQDALRPITCFEWVLLELENGYDKDEQIGFDLLLNRVELLYRSYRLEVLDTLIDYLPPKGRLVSALRLMILGERSESEVLRWIDEEKNEVWSYLYKLSVNNKDALCDEIQQIQRAYN